MGTDAGHSSLPSHPSHYLCQAFASETVNKFLQKNRFLHEILLGPFYKACQSLAGLMFHPLPRSGCRTGCRGAPEVIRESIAERRKFWFRMTNRAINEAPKRDRERRGVGPGLLC